jgi:5-methylcytosine-specific restriction endonuclease McrA
MPTRQTIADYWTGAEGQRRIQQIKETFEISVTALLCIEHDIAHCWACNKTLRGGRAAYNTPDLGLERCHIIPRSLGGTDHPSNLFLMCARCHASSPDTGTEVYFWRWFDQVEDHQQGEQRRLKQSLDISKANIEELSKLDYRQWIAYIKEASEEIETTTHGATIAEGTRAVLLQRALDLATLDHPEERMQWTLNSY